MSGKFYNFPISMLRGLMNNSDAVLGEILDFCIWENYQACNHDIESVTKRLGVSIGDIDGTLKRGKNLSRKYRRDGYPWTGIEHDVYWAFMNKNRSDFEKATLLAFLAIKSLVGDKPWYKVTNQTVIFKRMGGYKESDIFHITQNIKPFATRYFFDRIKLELKEKWGVVIYASHVRGMYISLDMSLDELALVAEKNKLRTRQKEQIRAAEAARKKAVEALMSKNSTNDAHKCT